tara:strand:- start:240 stop:440 length:201 start_codon:yes stop_codon:yes gene_type:complete
MVILPLTLTALKRILLTLVKVLYGGIILQILQREVFALGVELVYFTKLRKVIQSVSQQACLIIQQN